MTSVLVVEDDPQMSRALSLSLSARGYSVKAVETGRDALTGLNGVDLILLDLGLPDMDGLDVLREVRRVATTPVIVVSARMDRHEKVRALDGGADDYITKPFDFEELLARLRVAARRARPNAGAPTVTTPDFTIDMAVKEVRRSDGEQVHLTPTEWALVEELVRQPGMVISGRDLLRSVWGPDYENETNYLRVFFTSVRKKLEPEPRAPRYFITTPGIGYRFQPPDVGG